MRCRRHGMRHSNLDVLAAATLVVALTGCNDIAGLGDLEFRDMGAAGHGGEGGNGGATVAASDWSQDMLALYLFDSDDLGWDSAHGYHLAESGAGLSRDSEEAPQGESALVVNGQVATLTANHLELVIGMGGSFTLGLWALLEVDAQTILVSDMVSNGGYMLTRGLGGDLYCAVNALIQDGVYGSSPWPLQAWVHLACRRSAANGDMHAFVNGWPSTVPEPATDVGQSPGQLTINHPSFPIRGRIDEVFLSDKPLGDATILRIQICGVDGKACTCDANDPTQYASCQRVGPDCMWLTDFVPCNSDFDPR